MNAGWAVVWDDGGCFRVVADDGSLWVEEMLHPQAHERRGDIAKRWRIRFSTCEAARALIAGRLRQGHHTMYHLSTRAKTVAG